MRDNGKLLYDFILSKERPENFCRKTICFSVGNDVEQKGESVDEITKSAMTVDLQSLADNSDEIISTFDSVFK